MVTSLVLEIEDELILMLCQITSSKDEVNCEENVFSTFPTLSVCGMVYFFMLIEEKYHIDLDSLITDLNEFTIRGIAEKFHSRYANRKYLFSILEQRANNSYNASTKCIQLHSDGLD